MVDTEYRTDRTPVSIGQIDLCRLTFFFVRYFALPRVRGVLAASSASIRFFLQLRHVRDRSLAFEMLGLFL